MKVTTAKSSFNKKVFVAEDSLPVRTRLVEMLNEIDGVDVVGEASTPVDAITGILLTLPDYVVLDFQLEGGTGADVLRTLRSKMPGMIFIVITNHPQPQVRQACIEAGADAFFDKSTEIGRIKEVITGASPRRTFV